MGSLGEGGGGGGGLRAHLQLLVSPTLKWKSSFQAASTRYAFLVFFVTLFPSFLTTLVDFLFVPVYLLTKTIVAEVSGWLGSSPVTSTILPSPSFLSRFPARPLSFFLTPLLETASGVYYQG